LSAFFAGTDIARTFRIGRFVELPYTLAQDFTLIDVLGERGPRLWLEKVAYIRRYCVIGNRP